MTPTNNKISGKQVQEKLLYLAIALTPLIGIYELSEILNFSIPKLFPSVQAVKISKDVVISILIFNGIFFGFARFKKFPNIAYLLLFVTIICSILISFFSLPFDAIISGIRWLMPLIFFINLGKIDKLFLQKITKYLFLIFIIGFLTQIYEIFNMNGIYGINFSGLNIRNPGFYLSPSSMAAFSMSVLFYTMHFEKSNKKKHLTLILVFLSVLLTASGSGLISYFLFILFFVTKKMNLALIGIIIFTTLLISVPFLPVISGREDILLSPTGRIDIFINSLNWTNIFFSNQFGTGTNTFVSLRPDLLMVDFAIISDSMISSSIINCGLIFLIILFTNFFIIPVIKHKKSFYLFFATFLPFFLTTVLFELYPVNLLFFIALFSYKLNLITQ